MATQQPTPRRSVDLSSDTPLTPTKALGVYAGGCHCGAVRFEVQCSRDEIKCWDCNCSDCHKRRNLHFIVPQAQFRLTQGYAHQRWYTWGTHTALRPFCTACGILSYYVPRSNPDGVGVSVTCVDWPVLTCAQVHPARAAATASTATAGGAAPRVTVVPYDGVHWEDSHSATGIASESRGGGSGGGGGGGGDDDAGGPATEQSGEQRRLRQGVVRLAVAALAAALLIARLARRK